MPRTFQVPDYFRSRIVGAMRDVRRRNDPRKRDLEPSRLDLGPVSFLVPRHFGFCFGVENAVEVAYQALDKHPDRRLYMLSEMIHNQHVNSDLERRGMHFLRSATGEELISLDTLTPEDIVLIPAFGTSLEVKADLERRGIDTETYDTTCVFVEKVWRRSERLGKDDCTVVVHGKRYHEEVRATFSRAQQTAPVVVVRDREETETLCRVITGEESAAYFFEKFRDRYSDGFDPERDLKRIGVVNQTTMLVTETKEIIALIRDALEKRYGTAKLQRHFQDTSSTLCYATHENQEAARILLGRSPDLAIVVGGFNSSNTTHIVSLCQAAVPTYFVSNADAIESLERIRHFDIRRQKEVATTDWIPGTRPVTIALMAGASCPDVLLDQVIHRVADWMGAAHLIEDALASYDNVAVA